ncbi:uncharacterized protein GLRG_04160 [Colletotrichum graminicola M1.001]|uniref:Major facilitator superfamily transporter n=1 Tax=Colletotrichum graminicola (strain M1.001 / M2 / FGSC 10212) TaxID=645133 RepID=E3QDS8_COLGM|nr:uncharacterized protein GLRG_04160 [Colletotrichum graminicola M1.001]EFQ29016.1 hypothetical protein GLRG_04160 [Colletotrichum graminicola M1.001]
MAAFILRAAALAFVNAVSNCSSIHASYLYPARDGPQYKAALVHNCVACFVAVCAVMALRVRAGRAETEAGPGRSVAQAIPRKMERIR